MLYFFLIFLGCIFSLPLSYSHVGLGAGKAENLKKGKSTLLGVE